MTKYILENTTILPLSHNKPKQAIIMCHGYGGDGKDISSLAINWQRFLPDAVFLCPNGHEICEINPQGYQWFDLSKNNEEYILQKSLIAETIIKKFIDLDLNLIRCKNRQITCQFSVTHIMTFNNLGVPNTM